MTQLPQPQTPITEVRRLMTSPLEAEQTRGGNAYLKEWADVVWRAAYSVLGDREDANDIVSEVALRLCSTYAAYEERGRGRAYLVTIAKNLARNLIRARDRRPECSLDDIPPPGDDATPATVSWPSPYSDLAGPEHHDTEEEARLHADLDDAMGTLAADQRAVLWLRYYEKLKYRQIAEALGIEEEAARKRHARGLAELAVLMWRWDPTR